ncbi:probable flagellar basal-body rod protein [Phenylobacterium zucineum HLK1]|uniref:Flagellar basal body rod protein FlgB n=1 Tax=Phenylobacterium zucineum (strain HLK1) TaxID=450851 RepID=B4RGX2_PHEZH|nr:probable flagellar basal-body rod protein [Phenylobacterium zucineum HLK1]
MMAMNLAEIPLFQMLRGRLSHLTERQKVIAQNVANADTPGYVPQDVGPFGFRTRLQVSAAMAATQPGHMQPKNARSPSAAAYKARETASSETTLNGNAVVLEEEMMKMAEARINYDAAIGYYQKSLGILRLATKPAGRA